MKKSAFWVTILIICSLLLNCFVGTPIALAFTQDQKLLLQSWRLVNQAYIDNSFNNQNWWLLRQEFLQRNLHNREETYDTIDEMLATLDEPFTRLLRPEQYHNLQVSTAGELSGVGLQININPETGNLEVVAPLTDSPAESAGIKARDRILKIDGVDTATLTLDEAATKMRGSSGTQVSLTIKPYQDEKVIRQINIIRAHISLSPVFAELDNQTQSIPIGYVRINQFSANAAQDVADAVANLEQKGTKAYILDLRNNPGGLLQAGIEVARLWLNNGTIVHTVNRQGIQDSFSAFGAALTEAPLAVLVNERTASASEILAGALQDNSRGILVGEKTFGKGLIQSLFELPDGAGLAVTVAKYETPNHKDIHKLGIVPDEIVPQDPISYRQIGTDADLQYQAAIKLLTSNMAVAHTS
ncbi:MAG: carboxyl-terminal processing protease CtpA [cyanobacterium endosymbiont of Rhopalodia musculus]|uniref:carboxyl-terminal processing protease CtpA n=1 Tax=cyanobacterium endosymbiont of Epithemia clementina EcSB TaxID=3034674 RepID=UPI00247FC753|nr:carboxyl-terminal processing protease CtpA [cyanobacterium endosymbiont of Epithemia clementina EcSB]WGT68438.1 S41 family peptidase [cyanobacterium endosymbiont of Epithemia clementina EcSB]